MAPCRTVIPADHTGEDLPVDHLPDAAWHMQV